MQEHPSRRRSASPTSPKPKISVRLSSLKPKQEQTYRKSLEAIKYLREDRRRSLAQVAREAGTTPATVRRYVSSALSKRRGRVHAKPTDRLPRPLWLIDKKGRYSVRTHSSKTASLIGQYHNAIRAFIYYGDPSGLDAFRGRSVTIDGRRHEFLTDLRIISRLARAGELHILDIYVSEVH